MHDHGRLPAAECLELSLTLTKALGHLHQHGLIHRDIKPSNIIFVNGIPKLADIGLVADVGEARSFVGTEGFIPPEGPGTAQADLYSLGKVVYEICTGKDRQDYPELPTLIGEDGDRTELLELNEVVIKACDEDTTKRYQSAEEMHGDLAFLQAGKSLVRSRITARYWRYTRMAATTSAVILGILILPFKAGVFTGTLDSLARIRAQVATTFWAWRLKTRKNPVDGAEMVYVPSGSFLMGNQDGPDNEKPQHEQRIEKGFWMYRKEVTNAQFRRFLSVHPEWGTETLISSDLRFRRQASLEYVSDGDEFPVAFVAWEAAKAYAEWAGGRLPTESEWEYAARAGKQFHYATWEGLSPESSNSGNLRGTQNVGSYSPNWFGLFDMTGNVWQWCSSL